MKENVEGVLGVYRILDLTNERGFFCGKLLGDMGADVIKIEKPGGDPARSIGPFYHDIPDPEKSLNWWAFNTNKRGITLDIETVDGQEILKQLVKTADVLIESFEPGYMDKIGLSYATLSEINPKLIMASITGFGQKGPYNNFKSSDIVLWALSGQAYVTGDSDRAPLMPAFPISFLLGSLGAAIGIVVAFCHRGITGEGQHVDAPALLGLAWTVGPEVHGLWEGDKEIVTRSGRIWKRAQTGKDDDIKYINVPIIYPCKDGAIRYITFLQPGMLPSARALTQWIIDDGVASETLKQTDWSTFDWQTVDQKTVDEITESYSRFFLRHTKAELWEEAQKRGIQLYPLLSPKDMLEFEQLSSREYWTDIEHPELGTSITYPGAFLNFVGKPCKIERRAPLIGEHNQEIYCNELGLSTDELLVLKQSNIV
jgi:crotonobetainyl-CoA:carnitine CoA-transferase CaiB-like acyl-CoA transferase